MPAHEIPEAAQGPAPGPASSAPEPGVIRRYAVLAVLDVGAKGMGFAATVLIAKHFGAAGFGAIGYAQSIMAYGLMASACGLDIYAVKNAAALEERLPRIAGTVMALRLALGSGVYCILLAVAAAVPSMRAVFPLVAMFGLTFLTGAVSVAWVPQAIRRTQVLGLALMSIQAIYLGLVLLVTWHGLATWSVPASLVAAEAAVAAGLLIWMTRRVGRLERPLPPRESLSFLGRAAPIGGSQILRAAALGSDMVVIGMFLSLEEVGWYGGAQRVFLLGIGLVSVYFIVLFPQLARQAARSRAAVRGELRSSLLLTLPVAAVGVGVGLALAPLMLRLLYEPSFAAAARALRLLLLALFVYVVNGHVRNTLLALGRQQTDLKFVAVSSVVHVSAKLTLVPLLGITGAAAGTLAGEAALMTLAGLATWRALAARRPPGG